MSLQILKPGFLSLIQDYGRYGYQSIGVSNGGPLDEHAYLWSNYLLGNDYNAAQLEVNFGGFSATFEESTMIAICGADLNAELNGQAIQPWESYAVNVGDTLSFNGPKSGLRAYLAVKGGFQVEKQLLSCATVLREKLGGLAKNGSQLLEEDVVSYSAFSHEASKRVPSRYIPEYKTHIELRYIVNASATSAGEEAQKIFTNQPYEVTQNIDRMGYRLSGEPISTPLSGIISQGISMGAIQVPKDGQPIVLMRDRQTMGGYPLLGCVAYVDLPALAQSAPGTKVSFRPVNISEAEKDLIEHKKFFRIDV